MRIFPAVHPLVRAVLVLLASCLAVLAGYRALYLYDNKYTARAPVMQDGAAALGALAASPQEPLFLVDGWEVTAGRLLSPAEAREAGAAARRTYIGEFPSFAALSPDGSPYGCATYRLRLRGDGAPAALSLYLPEVPCAYRLYIDGVEVGGRGEPAAGGYVPRVEDAVYPLALEGEAELVVQAANYTHYYGGLYYPPAVGTPDAIAGLVGRRLGFYGALCLAPLAIALSSLGLWLGARGRRERLHLYFGALCVFFSLRVCYPFLHLEGAGPLRFVYALEDFAAMAGLLCTLGIVEALCGPPLPGWARALVRGVPPGMCAVCTLFPLAVLPALPGFLPLYGQIVSWYKVLASLYLVGVSFWGAGKGRAQALPLLAAVCASGTWLLLGVCGIGQFEPIRTAWPDENGAALLVAAFAALLARRSRLLVEENLRLTQRLHEEAAQKAQRVMDLVNERKSGLSGMIHDLKSPLTLILNYAQMIQHNGILLDDEVRGQARLIEQKCADMAGRMRTMQDFADERETPPRLERLCLNRFLEAFYRDNLPDVEVGGGSFTLALPAQECYIWGDTDKLSRALENLLFNAASFTPAGGRITLALSLEGGSACIQVADTGCGIPPEGLARVFDRFYTTRAQEGGRGLGLFVVRQVAQEHEGEVSVYSREGEGARFTIRLPRA